MIRSHGEGERKYFHERFGLNFRPLDIQAAIGRVQLHKVNEFIERRNEIARRYERELATSLSFQFEPDYVTVHPWMIFLARANDSRQRDSLVDHLRDHGIDVRVPWLPVHAQPYHTRIGKKNYPKADRVYSQILSLPIGNAVTEREVRYVASTVKDFFKQDR
jgi:dTDP-4-amino-4,6-dideoxygalactose transaminase